MKSYMNTSIETRYCHAANTQFASGDQLLYLLDDGWQVIHVTQEIYLRGGRRVRVFVFTLYRDRDAVEVSVSSTPVIERFAQRFATSNIYETLDFTEDKVGTA